MRRRLSHGSLAPAGAVVALLAVAPAARAQAPTLPVAHPTPAEAAGHLAFTDPAEVGPYLSALAAADGVTVDTLPGPVPIPVVRVASTAPATATGVVRVLVVGAQHGTERAGLEVGLGLARDLAVGPLARLRARLDVKIVPMANPTGVERRRRETASGVDMATDHVRLEAHETRALWREFAAWRPHLVLDLHELGPSEYPVQIGVPTHPNAPSAATFARYYLLPYAANRLARSDIPFHEYVVQWTDGRQVEGAAFPTPATDTGAARAPVRFTPPALDPSSARNAFSLAGSVGFFVAVASSRDIVGLEERAGHLHLAVASLLEAAAGLASELIATTEASKRLPKSPLALRARYVPKDAVASLSWFFVNDRGQRERGALSPWHAAVAVDAALAAPAGWWIPNPSGLADVLRGHGFEISEDAPPPAREGRLAYPRCAPGSGDEAAGKAGAERAARAALRPVEGPPEASHSWVDAAQPGGRLLFTLIEPWASGGWFEATGPHERAGAACSGAPVHPVQRVP